VVKLAGKGVWVYSTLIYYSPSNPRSRIIIGVIEEVNRKLQHSKPLTLLSVLSLLSTGE